MLDRYSRQITYLRVSITDRCNLRCVYCMPEDGVVLKRHEDILGFEEIRDIVAEAVNLGITKIRITGGEPLVRRGVVDLTAMLARVDGIGEVAMTTNGTLLAPLARPLREAGLDRINISLDTLDPDRYSAITRGGRLQDAVDGIAAATEAGFPVKINMVRPQGSSADELAEMRRFCQDRGLQLQLIREYSLTTQKRDDVDHDRPRPCSECNRIRLLADGTLKPCLHSDISIPVDLTDIATSLKQAIDAKPVRGTVCTERGIAQIGG